MDQEQGIRASGCYYCRLLYPDSEGPCPECGNRTGLVAAQMLSEESVRERVRDDVRAFRDQTDPVRQREQLRGLLHSLFHGAVAVSEAAAAGADLDTLRRLHEAAE